MMIENFPNLGKDIIAQVQEVTSWIQTTEIYRKTYYNQALQNLVMNLAK